MKDCHAQLGLVNMTFSASHGLCFLNHIHGIFWNSTGCSWMIRTGWQCRIWEVPSCSSVRNLHRGDGGFHFAGIDHSESGGNNRFVRMYAKTFIAASPVCEILHWATLCLLMLNALSMNFDTFICMWGHTMFCWTKLGFLRSVFIIAQPIKQLLNSR